MAVAFRVGHFPSQNRYGNAYQHGVNEQPQSPDPKANEHFVHRRRVLDNLTALPTMYMGLVLPSLVASWSQQKGNDFKIGMQKTFDLFLMC